VLANLQELLASATRGDRGVASFNVFGWEDAQAVTEAAARLGAPVVLAANLDFRRSMPIEVIAALLRALAQRAPVPVGVHLDHCDDLDEARHAVDLGFTSVMYDGSQLPLEANIAATLEVLRFAHAAGCSVEAEIGSVPYAQGRSHIRSELTEVADAARFCAACKVDALAVSVGNVHRMQSQAASLDFERLAAIKASANAPLVIHGASGVARSDVPRLVAAGVAKFNIGTVLRQAFGRGLRSTLARHPERYDRLEIFRDAMEEVVREADGLIRLLGWTGQDAAASGDV
jgi:fructose-bisphosphate aldolase class II